MAAKLTSTEMSSDADHSQLPDADLKKLSKAQTSLKVQNHQSLIARWIRFIFTDIHKLLVISCCYFFLSRSEWHRDENKKAISYSLLFFVLSLQLYLSISPSHALRGSEVSILHFHPSSEKTSVSHVKYLRGHLVFFSISSLPGARFLIVK